MKTLILFILAFLATGIINAQTKGCGTTSHADHNGYTYENVATSDLSATTQSASTPISFTPKDTSKRHPIFILMGPERKKFYVGDSILEFLKPSSVKTISNDASKKIIELSVDGQTLWLSHPRLVRGGERDSVNGKVVLDSSICVMGVVIPPPAAVKFDQSTAQVIPVAGDEKSPTDPPIGLGWWILICAVGIAGGIKIYKTL